MKAKIIFRLEEEEEGEDEREEDNSSRCSLLAANLRLYSDLCLTFTNLRSGRSKEVTGHLAVANRY